MFVQFETAEMLEVIASFGEAQSEVDWPNQGEVEEDDPRFLRFLAIASGAAPVVADEGADARAWRDAEISRVAWLRDRHRDEVELGGATTITPEQYTELLGYIQQLRDWPLIEGFPDASSRPDVPGWIANQIQ